MTIPDRYLSPPETVDLEESIPEAARKMRDHHVGSLVVVDEDGYPHGIVTDRDLALYALREPREGARMVDCMSHPAITVRKNQTLQDASKIMRKHGVRRLPVIDKRAHVVGFVAADDLIWEYSDVIRCVSEATRSNIEQPSGPPSGSVSRFWKGVDMLAKEVCIPRVSTIEKDASIGDAAKLMAHDAVGSLVVLDGEDGEAVGIVTDRDLTLRAVACELSPDETKVASVMTSPLICVNPEETLEVAMSLMRGSGIRRVPLCQDGKPVGILTVDDLLEQWTQNLANVGSEAHLKRTHSDRHRGFEEGRDEVVETLDEIHEKLAYGAWRARESFLHEVDDLKGLFRRALGLLDSD